MNVCIFAGRLTADAKSKDVNGTAVASYTVACDSGWGEKKSTMFVNCVHWKPGGVLQYMTKGKPVIVRGQLRERTYQAQDGTDRKITELVVAEMEFQQRDKTEEQQPQRTGGQNASMDHGHSPRYAEDEDIPF